MAFGAKSLDGGCDDIHFLAPERSVFARMRVEPGDGDAGAIYAKLPLQPARSRAASSTTVTGARP